MKTETTRAVVLVVLTFQNAVQSIILTQSRKPNDEGQTYNASVAILLQEMVKVVLSVIVLFGIQHHRQISQIGSYQALDTSDDYMEIEKKKQDDRPVGQFAHTAHLVQMEVFTLDLVKMMLPAALYVAQNHLQMVAASYIDSTTFAVFSQLKIVTTAIFTVALLGRVITKTQWVCVFGVFIGVAAVQAAPHASSHIVIGSADQGVSPAILSRSSVGLLALLGSCILSGFAGVYTEKVMTRSTSSLFANSLQMALCSMVPAAIPVLLRILDGAFGKDFQEGGLFVAFGAWAWIAVGCNVWGGFMVALTMKIASSLAKSFATSVAVLLTFLLSFLFLQEPLGYVRMGGAVLVVVNVYGYSVSSLVPPETILPLTERRDTEASERH